MKRLIAITFTVVGLAIIAAPAARAQTTNDELRELRAEMQRLRQEVAALRKELRESRLPPAAVVPAVYSAPNPPAAAAATQEASTAAQMELLRAQVQEQAQTKVESNSRWPVKIFGAIVSNTFFNAGRHGEADWIDGPTIVAVPAAGLPHGSFSSSMRQTRLGASVEGPTINGMRSSAVVAVDFFGTIPQFDNGPVMGQPRLLYAYARLQGERTVLQIGQDQMIFAPNNPTSLAAMSFPDLYRSGNLYVRYPQVRVERTRNFGSNKTWTFTGGIIAPLGGAPLAPGTFVYADLPGERSMHPAFQGRTAWRGSSGNHSFELGASGHIGRVRFPAGAQQSWGFATDFDARAGRFGVGGEMFVGENLAALGGALGQFARSAGGFIEGRWKATDRLNLNAGYGTDRLFDLGSAFGTIRYASNASVFGNFIYRFTPEFETSLEYRWLNTDPLTGSTRQNNHVNLVFVYRF
jgi:hypothetical protein